MLALRRRAEAAVRAAAADAAIFAAEASRLPNTFAFALPAIRAETALIAFDLDGVALSSGSACSSGARMCSTRWASPPASPRAPCA